MFDPAVAIAARQHALDEYPREACGLVVEGEYERCSNIAADPKKGFKISERDITLAWARGLDAVVHSHPDWHAIPSEHDMRQQIAHAVPFGIVATDGKIAQPPVWFGDQAPIPPLLDRGFRHGVTDCCSLIRDLYRSEQGDVNEQFRQFRIDWPHHRITIDEGPRDWEWWLPGKDADGNPTKPKNLYLDSFGPAGFVKIDGSERRCGDVVLIEIRTRKLADAGLPPGTPMHAGIYLGGDLVVHHLTADLPVDPSRRPKVSPIGSYRNMTLHWLRYRG